MPQKVEIRVTDRYFQGSIDGRAMKLGLLGVVKQPNGKWALYSVTQREFAVVDSTATKIFREGVKAGFSPLDVEESFEIAEENSKLWYECCQEMKQKLGEKGFRAKIQGLKA